MKLYDLPFSCNAHKVRAVAAELGIPLELHTVDLMKGEGRSPAYLAKNPNGKVPTLEDGDFVLWESNAIICYLAAQKPEAGLVPGDIRMRADMDRWLFWQAATFAPTFTPLVIERIIKPMMGATTDEAAAATARKEVERFLPVLEQGLASKEYLLGRLSLADFSIAATVSLTGPTQVDLSAYPNITAWFGRVSARESWKSTAAGA